MKPNESSELRHSVFEEYDKIYEIFEEANFKIHFNYKVNIEYNSNEKKEK